ncbi:integrase, catalytic region, zinc finger, CCHC-type containing protein [Tanacetum coccineum]
MSKVFTELGYKWKPTGKLFTLVGNSCPLTRFTLANLVPPKETTYHSVETPKPEIKVYIRRPKQIKTAGSSKKAKIVESKIANNSEPNHSWGSNAIDVPSSSSLVNDSKFLGTVRFENEYIAKIMGYGDYQLGIVTISRVYYVEGLRHNLFSVRQFCDLDLEVAFWKNTCFIQNLDGVELFSSFKDSNLYTISLDDMLKTSLICLLSKALKTKSEETDEITDLYQDSPRIMFSERRDDITSTKQRRRDLSGDGVRDLVIAHNIAELKCSFHGLWFEDPNQHLKYFLKLMDSFDLDGENKERTRLRLFQFSLHDQASNWLERLLAGSITTWKDLTTRFLAQLFSSGRTAKLYNDILMSQQHYGESLSEAWTHFKELLQKVPHHGIDLWL